MAGLRSTRVWETFVSPSDTTADTREIHCCVDLPLGVVVGELEVEFVVDGGAILGACLFEDADEAAEGVGECVDFPG